MWTPGYWAWGGGGYYWVPGTWVQPPRVGVLWTPGYWGFVGGVYAFHGGYWGPHIGYYGGVNYGFGYVGVGFAGGRWVGNSFAYNRTVMNVNVTNVHNTYNETVINNVSVTKVSYNGGPGGTAAVPTAQERAAAAEPHVPPTAMQHQHVQEALRNPALERQSQWRSSGHCGNPATGGIQCARRCGGARREHAAERRATRRTAGSVWTAERRATHAGTARPAGRCATRWQPGQPGQPNNFVRTPGQPDRRTTLRDAGPRCGSYTGTAGQPGGAKPPPKQPKPQPKPEEKKGEHEK